MKILVTGAAGFIGSHMAERLKEEGHQVLGIDNFSDYYPLATKRRNAEVLAEKGIPILRMDLRESSGYENLALDFELIIHFAAQPGISSSSTFEDYLTNNILATQNLLLFANLNKNLQHFFNIATSSIYGLEATCAETQEPKPASWYGVTKLAAEQLVLAQSRANLLKASSLRLYSVYGPRERPEKLYTKLIACAYKNEVFTLFKGSEKHLRSFTYVGDIVDGILKAIQNREALNGEIINLGSETENSTQQGIAYVEELLGLKIGMEIIAERPGDQLRTLANIDKARKLLGYNPATSLKEGLKLQIEWYKTEFL